MPVSPKNVVVAGRVSSLGGLGGGWVVEADVEGVWAPAAAATNAKAAAKVKERSAVIIGLYLPR
jgi:hypothetical protein